MCRWVYADRSLRAKQGYVLYPDWFEARRLWAVPRVVAVHADPADLAATSARSS